MLATSVSMTSYVSRLGDSEGLVLVSSMFSSSYNISAPSSVVFTDLCEKEFDYDLQFRISLSGYVSLHLCCERKPSGNWARH